jgi:outer membrane immunogenic protein
MCWTLSCLMVLAQISPARSAAQYHNHLMIRMFSRPYPNALASALAGPAFIMRRLFVAFGLMGGLLSPAFAADYDLPVLRGSEPLAPVMTVGPATFTRWSGFYAGGDFSYNYANADFSGATQPLLSFSLRQLTLESENTPSQWQVLGNGNNSAFGFGGFLGYNTQWQDLVLGIEADYTHTSLSATASSSSIGRVVPAGSDTDSVVLTGTGRLNLTDYAEVRGRAGWIVGNLLPYGFIGFVVGRADYSVTTQAFIQQNSATPAFFPCDPALPTCVTFNPANSAGQNNALLYGYSAGGGLDWALTQNFFLRGEFEFIQFAPITNINVYIINARAGAGFKF